MTENIEPYLQPQKRQIIADQEKEQQLLKMAKEHYESYEDVAKFAKSLNLRHGVVYLTLKYHNFIKQNETTQYRVLDSYYRHNGDLKEITKDVGLTVWIVAKTLEQLNLSPNWASYKDRAETGLKGDWAENEFKRLVPSAIDMNMQYQMNNPRFDFVVNNKEIDVKYSSVRKVRGSKQYALRYDPDNLPDFFCLFASDDEVEKSDDPPFTLEQITPKHIKMYLDWRKDLPKSANNEVRIFNHIWNMAREWGYTTAFSPAMGIKKHKTEDRDVYIEDYILDKFKKFADQEMRDLIDIAYLTGQRPIDIVNIHKSQIFDDILHITQQKTKAKVRIKLVGKLADIIKRRMNATDKNYLFSNKRNGKFSRNLLSRQFAKLRERVIKAYPEIEDELKNIQFRDLRAKAATDQYLEKDEETAQKQLGHTSPTMTKRYIRKDKIVMPTKR